MQFQITEIDHASFPERCPSGYKDEDLPILISIETNAALTVENGDFLAPCFRSDAAASSGILAHSPYCECSYDHDAA